MATRDANKATVKEQLARINDMISQAVTAKETYRKAMDGVNALSRDYSAEYLAAKKQEVVNAYAVNNQGIYANMATRLETLKGALLELHSQLDLTDPALRTALDLVKAAGSELDGDTVRMINSQFVGNQPALQCLQAAYRAAGTRYDGGLDRQIYNAEDAIAALGNFAKAALQQQGSLNALGSAFVKVASLEGYGGYDGTPDPVGAMEAMRRGAGLPEK
jgi:hypothetical protein